MSKIISDSDDNLQSDTSLSIMGYYTPCTINHIDETTGIGGIYNQRVAAGTVPNGSPINIANLRTIGTGVTYDAGTATVNANRTGIYLFIWHVLANITTNAADATDNILIALEDTLSNQIALSGNISTGSTAVLVTGSTVVELTSGKKLSLINRSGADINLVPVTSTTGTSYSASLTVVRIS